MTGVEQLSGTNMKMPKVLDITIMKNLRIQNLEKMWLVV